MGYKLLEDQPDQSNASETKESVSFCPVKFVHRPSDRSTSAVDSTGSSSSSSAAPVPTQLLHLSIHWLSLDALTERRADLINELASAKEDLALEPASDELLKIEAGLKKQLHELELAHDALQHLLALDKKRPRAHHFQIPLDDYRTTIYNIIQSNDLQLQAPGHGSDLSAGLASPVDLRSVVDHLELCHPLFQPGLEFVDLPGLNDRIRYRANAAERYLVDCDHILLTIKHGERPDAIQEASVYRKVIAHTISKRSDMLHVCALSVLNTMIDGIQFPEEVPFLQSPTVQKLLSNDQSFLEELVRGILADYKLFASPGEKPFVDALIQNMAVHHVSAMDYLKLMGKMQYNKAKKPPACDDPQETSIPAVLDLCRTKATELLFSRHSVLRLIAILDQICAHVRPPLQGVMEVGGAADSTYKHFLQQFKLMADECSQQMAASFTDTMKVFDDAQTELKAAVLAAIQATSASPLLASHYRTLRSNLRSGASLVPPLIAAQLRSHLLLQLDGGVAKVAITSLLAADGPLDSIMCAAVDSLRTSIQKLITQLNASGSLPTMEQSRVLAIHLSFLADLRAEKVFGPALESLAIVDAFDKRPDVMKPLSQAGYEKGGSGILSRMVNAVAKQLATPVFQNAAVDIVMKLLREALVSRLVDPLKNLCADFNKLEGSEFAADLQPTFSILTNLRLEQAGIDRTQVLNNILHIRSTICDRFGVRNDEVNAWTTKHGFINQTRSAPKLSPTVAHESSMLDLIARAHHRGLVDTFERITDGFFWVPWNWKQPIPSTLELMWAIPHDPNFRNEILLMDARDDKVLGDVVRTVKDYLVAHRDQSLQDRVKWLARFVFNDAFGGLPPKTETRSRSEMTCEIVRKLRENASLNNGKGTNVIKIGDLLKQPGVGVCRHRSMLFKYLADITVDSTFSNLRKSRSAHTHNAIECRLVRGIKTSGHVWNVVLIRSKSYLLETMNKIEPERMHPTGSPAAKKIYRRGVGKVPVAGTTAGNSIAVPSPSVSFDELSAIGLTKLTQSSQHVIWVCAQPDYKRLALDPDTFTPAVTAFAIKMPLDWDKQTAAVRKVGMDKLINEHNALMQIAHPQVVRLVGQINVVNNDALPADKPPGLVLSYDSGAVPLHTFLGVKLSIEHILGLARSLAGAVLACHGVDIVHRDLHHSNVLLNDRTMEPTLIDFGHAVTLIEDDKKLGQRRFAHDVNLKEGLKPFVPPRRSGDRGFPTAFDSYSFGVLILELMHGKKLDVSSTSSSLRSLAIQTTFLHDDFRALIKKCLDEEPSKRPDFFEIEQQLLDIHLQKDTQYQTLPK